MTLRMGINGVPHVLAAEHHVQALLVGAQRYLQLGAARAGGRTQQRIAVAIEALRDIAPMEGDDDDTIDPRD